MSCISCRRQQNCISVQLFSYIYFFWGKFVIKEASLSVWVFMICLAKYWKCQKIWRTFQERACASACAGVQLFSCQLADAAVEWHANMYLSRREQRRGRAERSETSLSGCPYVLPSHNKFITNHTHTHRQTHAQTTHAYKCLCACATGDIIMPHYVASAWKNRTSEHCSHKSKIHKHMRRCLCAAALHLPPSQSLRCACRAAACAQLVCICCKYCKYSQNYYTWHDWIYRWVHTIYQRYQSRPHPDGEANPFQCPVASPASAL